MGEVIDIEVRSPGPGGALRRFHSQFAWTLSKLIQTVAEGAPLARDAVARRARSGWPAWRNETRVRQHRMSPHWMPLYVGDYLAVRLTYAPSSMEPVCC